MARRFLFRLAATLFWAISSACASQAAPCSLAGLGWMAGSWHNAKDPKGAQERWVVAPNNVLMGSSWEFPQGQSGFAEVMTIKEDGNATSMVLRHFDGGLRKAWEERDAPMVFSAANCNRNTVVFDGQGDHAGEHMTYRRSGESLLIIGDFLHHGTPDHEEWQMVLAGN